MPLSLDKEKLWLLRYNKVSAFFMLDAGLYRIDWLDSGADDRRIGMV